MAAFKIEDRPYATAEIEVNGKEHKIGIKSPGVKFTTAMADFSDEFEILEDIERKQNSKNAKQRQAYSMRDYSRQAAKVLQKSKDVILSMVLEKEIISELFDSREWSLGELEALLAYLMDQMAKVDDAKKKSPAAPTGRRRRKK